MWRREQDSNLQALTGGSFQDYCITNYAISPQMHGANKKYSAKRLRIQLEIKI